MAIGVTGSGNGGLLWRWSHPLKANHHDRNHQPLSIMMPLLIVDSHFSFFSSSSGPLAENFTVFVLFFCFFFFVLENYNLTLMVWMKFKLSIYGLKFDTLLT